MSEFAGLQQPLGMVTFNLNGLHTLSPRSAERYIPYNEAVLYCQFLEISGYRGWRFPTIDELTSLTYLSYASLSGGFYWATDYNGEVISVMMPSATTSIINANHTNAPRVIRPIHRNL